MGKKDIKKKKVSTQQVQKVESKRKNFILYGVIIVLLLGLIITNNGKLKDTMMSDSSGLEDSKLFKIVTITLKTCNTCDNVKEYTEKIKGIYPDIKFENLDIEKDTEEINKYGLKEHPTILFLNKTGFELERLEKDIDYDLYVKTIEELINSPKIPKPFEEKKNESYGSSLVSLYLLDKNNEYIEIKQFLENKTSIRYPKIGAIKFLLSFRKDLPEGLFNPIPKGVELENISSEGDITIIQLSKEFEKTSNTIEGKHAENMIVNTLKKFKGVKQIQIISGNYKSDIYSEVIGKISSNKKYSPNIEITDWTPSLYVKQYNYNILYMDELAFMPCFCGCKEIGHTSNSSCYFKNIDEGTVVLDKHGEYCKTCIDITNDFVEMRTKGKSLEQIRKSIDTKYFEQRDGKTDTPQPNA